MVGLTLGLATWIVPAAAKALPFEGEAAVESADAKGRAKALAAARLAALEAAVARVEVAVDGKALAQLRANADAWTSSYRVLASGEGEGGSLRVEVEIDLPRLTKRLAVRTAGPGVGFRVTDWQAGESCGGADALRGAGEEPLRAAGVLSDAATRELRVKADCNILGTVPASRLIAARAAVELGTSGGRRHRSEGFGFGGDEGEATRAAQADAMRQLAPRLREEAAGSVVLRILEVGDGSRVRRLESAIREGVLGVVDVGVSAVEVGGVVRVAVRGVEDPGLLAERLRQLSFPDFSLDVSSTDASDELVVEFR